MEQVIVLGAVFAVMYAFIILPQQRRQKEAASLLAGLEEGDEIVIGAGIHGFITTIDGDVLWVEVAEGVDLKVSRNAVVNKIVAVEEVVHSADPLDEDKSGEA